MAEFQALMVPLRLGFGKVGVFTGCNTRGRRKRGQEETTTEKIQQAG